MVLWITSYNPRKEKSHLHTFLLCSDISQHEDYPRSNSVLEHSSNCAALLVTTSRCVRTDSSIWSHNIVNSCKSRHKFSLEKLRLKEALPPPPTMLEKWTKTRRKQRSKFMCEKKGFFQFFFPHRGNDCDDSLLIVLPPPLLSSHRLALHIPAALLMAVSCVHPTLLPYFHGCTSCFWLSFYQEYLHPSEAQLVLWPLLFVSVDNTGVHLVN